MSSSARRFAGLAALLLATATALGAWQTHILPSELGSHAVKMVGTAIMYQFFYGLGLLAVALLRDRIQSVAIRVAGWLMFAGIVIFCCAIYTRYLIGIPAAVWLAPVGGTTMIASWIVLAFGLMSYPDPHRD